MASVVRLKYQIVTENVFQKRDKKIKYAISRLDNSALLQKKTNISDSMDFLSRL